MIDEHTQSGVTEIILYRLNANAALRFYQTMVEHSLPLHRSAGIQVAYAGRCLEDRNVYCLARSFPNAEAMRTVLADFYASAAWREGPRADIVNGIAEARHVLLPADWTTPSAS